MQKNWYMLYTKTKCERKVSNLLTRKKIENFCPFVEREVESFRRTRVVSQALFDSYVFVKTEEENLRQLIYLENVISVVYWKNSPAKVSENEIEIMKKLLASHSNITVKKTRVNPMGLAVLLERPGYTRERNVVIIKQESFKVDLPSIGFTMYVSIEDQKGFGWGQTKEKELLLHS